MGDWCSCFVTEYDFVHSRVWYTFCISFFFFEEALIMSWVTLLCWKGWFFAGVYGSLNNTDPFIMKHLFREFSQIYCSCDQTNLEWVWCSNFIWLMVWWCSFHYDQTSASDDGDDSCLIIRQLWAIIIIENGSCILIKALQSKI